MNKFFKVIEREGDVSLILAKPIEANDDHPIVGWKCFTQLECAFLYSELIKDIREAFGIAYQKVEHPNHGTVDGRNNFCLPIDLQDPEYLAEKKFRQGFRDGIAYVIEFLQTNSVIKISDLLTEYQEELDQIWNDRTASAVVIPPPISGDLS
jgi:hypothetical protein